MLLRPLASLGMALVCFLAFFMSGQLNRWYDPSGRRGHPIVLVTLASAIGCLYFLVEAAVYAYRVLVK
jgi:hypothetical protein